MTPLQRRGRHTASPISQLCGASAAASVSLHPLGSAPALLNYAALAELFVFMGDHGRARAVLSAGLASRRPTARFLRTAALLERRLGDAAAAAQLLARAVARAPRDYRSWLAVGVCYLKSVHHLSVHHL
jgi:Tfp pilus assembly protein PilF